MVFEEHGFIEQFAEVTEVSASCLEYDGLPSYKHCYFASWTAEVSGVGLSQSDAFGLSSK
jgi:hypothetical protein